MIGAAYVTGLTLWTVRTPTVDERDLGAQARQIEALVRGRFHGEIDRIAVAIVAAALVVGAGLGIAAGTLLSLRRNLHPALHRGRTHRPLEVLAVVVPLQGALELWGMAHDPPLGVARSKCSRPMFFIPPGWRSLRCWRALCFLRARPRDGRSGRDARRE